MFQRDIVAYLEAWKKKGSRKPLILRGARQTGKTYAIKMFARKNFDDLVYINLDKADDFELFGRMKTVADFEKTVDVVFKKKIRPDRTLIFIDEIQNSLSLIELLRFFYEEHPDWHVAAAGSLLEAKIAREGLEMPVGRIEYAYMHPLTFFEFLGAAGEEKLEKFLREVKADEKIPDAIHKRALKLFRDYALVGGMPEAVGIHARGGSQEELNTFYSSLLTAYSEDIYKYSSTADVKYIKHVLEQAPYFAGERITYEKFGASVYRSREMGEAFGVLEKTMVIRQMNSTQAVALPLVGQKKRAKKLLYLDLGLVNFKNNIQSEYIKTDELDGLYGGKAAEQIVGQNILADLPNMERELFYWTRENPQSSAEVDFCFVESGKIIGIEVKSGHASRLKSLWSFGGEVKENKLIRVYSGEMKLEKISVSGKKFNLLSLPFYLVNRISDLASG